MLRYGLGQKLLHVRTVTPEEEEHVSALLASAQKRVTKLQFILAAGTTVFLLGTVAMFFPIVTDYGFGAIMLDFFVMLRIVLGYRDALRPLRLLRASVPLQLVAEYRDPQYEECTILHPDTGLLIRQGSTFVNAVIKVEGVQEAEEVPYPDAGWYPFERQHDRGLDCRPLSENELLEFQVFRSQNPFKTNGFLLIASWVFVGGIVSIFDSKSSLPPVISWLCVLGGLLSVGLHIRWNSLYIQMWRDRLAKKVVRVDIDGSKIEYLPYSGIIWTKDESPSELRQDGTYRIFNRRILKSNKKQSSLEAVTAYSGEGQSTSPVQAELPTDREELQEDVDHRRTSL